MTRTENAYDTNDQAIYGLSTHRGVGGFRGTSFQWRGVMFLSLFGSTNNVGPLVELKEDEERSPLRKSQPRDMAVIYSVG